MPHPKHTVVCLLAPHKGDPYVHSPTGVSVVGFFPRVKEVLVCDYFVCIPKTRLKDDLSNWVLMFTLALFQTKQKGYICWVVLAKMGIIFTSLSLSLSYP